MPMYKLLEYSKNYKKTTGNLWNYYRDEPSNPLSSNSESFKYKTSITGNNYNVGVSEAGYDANKVGKNKTEVVISLKHLSNFWRMLNIPLINCINSTKLYVPVITLSKENDTKFLEQLKSGFKRIIKWNKYRSQMTIQPQNNNLNYLIDLTFTNVNRLVGLVFTRDNAGDNRDSFSHYVPNVEIKDFNVLIDGKSFFDLPVENEEDAYEKIIEMSNNNDYNW